MMYNLRVYCLCEVYSLYVKQFIISYVSIHIHLLYFLLYVTDRSLQLIDVMKNQY